MADGEEKEADDVEEGHGHAQPGSQPLTKNHSRALWLARLEYRRRKFLQMVRLDGRLTVSDYAERERRDGMKRGSCC